MRFRSPIPRRFVTILVASVVVAGTTHLAGADDAAPTKSDGEWIQLFNGRDLTGWTPKIVGHEAGDNFANTFRVKDGVLCVSYDDYEGEYNDRFGHLFYKDPFSKYVLRCEYRLVGEQFPGAPEWAWANSGIMIHGQTPESMGLDQSFPVSIEVQLHAGDKGSDRHTANLCSPGTHVVRNGVLHTAHCTNSSSPAFPIGEWVTVELEVDGGNLIRHKVNGETVFEYSDPQLDPKDKDAKKLLEAGSPLHLTGGTISLQSESHPVEFRKVELKRLAE